MGGCGRTNSYRLSDKKIKERRKLLENNTLSEPLKVVAF